MLCMPKTSNSFSSGSRQASFKMDPQVQPKCFRHLQHMRNNWELRKRGYLIRFGHTEALLLKKRTLNGHFSRPAETDPYVTHPCRNNDKFDMSWKMFSWLSRSVSWAGCKPTCICLGGATDPYQGNLTSSLNATDGSFWPSTHCPRDIRTPLFFSE